MHEHADLDVHLQSKVWCHKAIQTSSVAVAWGPSSITGNVWVDVAHRIASGRSHSSGIMAFYGCTENGTG